MAAVIELPEWARAIVSECAAKRTADEEAAVRVLLDGLYTDLPFDINGLRVVSKRYLQRDAATGRVIETPEQMFLRVARALAEIERDYGAPAAFVDKCERSFFSVMARFQFTPAGRTLANAGTPRAIVANCVVLHIEDDMESIFGTLRDAALLQKAGCGLGFPLHLMRPADAPTVSSQGTASGPVSFLHVYNAAFGVIKQQGRHGANMAVMSVEHPDILEFISCKRVEGAIKNFNISVGITDRFMRAVEAGGDVLWKCTFGGVEYDPREIARDANYCVASVTPRPMTAKQLFDVIVHHAWNNGEPGVVFLDTANNVNPVPGLGRLETTNPCGEQFLHDGDVCNLGSINLERFYDAEARQVDFEALGDVTEVAVRMLDNVIDASRYPIERLDTLRRANRRIGLGVMGFADLLIQLGVGYNTEAGLQAARHVMSVVNEVAHNASEDLAYEKGVFPNWSKSVYAARDRLQRNAAVTTVAPTGAIAMMFNVSGGLEPYFALAYHYKNILGGDVQLQYVNKHLAAALEKAGANTPEVMERVLQRGVLAGIAEIPEEVRRTFVTSMDVSAEAHTRMQAAFQEHCDNSISKTINFPFTATQEDCARGYILAWKLGCKGCTVYRDGSRFQQVLNLNTTEAGAAADAELAPAGGPTCPDCSWTLTRSEGCNLCAACGYSACDRA